MEVFYNCRHCGTEVGRIRGDVFHTDKLGFDTLSNEERSHFVSYDEPNQAINVSTICENCQEALEQNPDLHRLDNIIQ